MITRFRQLSIRRKQMLIITLTSTVALLLACGAFVSYDVLEFRAQLASRIGGIAEIIASHSTASLDFNDSKSAEETLTALRTDTDVVGACIYDREGHVFAEYTRDAGGTFMPPLPRANGHSFSGGRMDLYLPILQGREPIGTIYIQSDLQELPRRVMRYAEIAGLVFVISLFVALVLSSRLQRVVLDPILHLAKLAKVVAEEKNYSVRAQKLSSDELGQLIDGFNEMLTQIQQRDNALQGARDNLEQRVQERTNELAKSLSLLNATLNSTPNGIVALDLSGNIICHNERFPAIWDFPEDILKRGASEEIITYCAERMLDREAYFRRAKEVMAHPEQAATDVLLLRDGRVLERVAYPQFLDGKCIGRVLTFRDITERKRAEANLQKANAELVQASRRAGMAEVATNVLHNVGNVLNSVNTSASVVMDLVRASKLQGVARVVELLEAHKDDLGGFFARDKRGRQSVEYLKTLSNFLASEQATMLKELAALTKNIDHIKQIVTMQQSYARASGVEELHSPAHLVEDALRIQEGGLERHGIRVVRDFDPVPDILADKHKVLQILINLIGNAKYALLESDNDNREATLAIKAVGNDAIQISIKDNGVGIAPENLIRIFSHGFTTRKNGHGFGLHSGFLAAKEMGGSLSVHSPGKGKGATFTLELPINTRSKASP